MRARLNSMQEGTSFTFLCLPIMTEQMHETIVKSGGKLHKVDERNYGVVMTAVKIHPSLQLPAFLTDR